MFKLSLIEGIKNIDKNKKITYLSVILFTLLFLLQSYTYSYQVINDLQEKSLSHESIKNYQLYDLYGPPYPFLDNFYPGSLNGYDLERETAEFYEALDNAQYVKYSNTSVGGLIIENFKGDYSTFFYDEYFDDDDGLFYIRTLYTAPNFHKNENYRVIKGRDFTDEDMIFVEGKAQAVLLGYKYLDVYEVGDLLDCYCEGDYQRASVLPKLEVIGFLEEDTTVINPAGTHLLDLDNCVIYPRYFIPIEDWDNYSSQGLRFAYNTDTLRLFVNMMYFIDSEHEAEGLEEFQTALNEYAGFAKYYKLVNRNQALEKIHTRTETFTNFALMITGVLMAFALITVIFSVINRIENNLKDYTIHVSLGASSWNIIGFVVAEMAIIMACSVALGLIFVKGLLARLYMPYYFTEFLEIFSLTSVLVILLSAVTARIAIKKYDLCTLIK